MTDLPTLSKDIIDAWADELKGPVALHLKQRLLPVEGEGGVIFPPTYADIGYNLDTLSDGNRVATIDSVGSQANRMEPTFKMAPYSELVPQIEIELHATEQDGRKHVERLSILDLAHRSADAVVYSAPTLAGDVSRAFMALRQRGDAGPLCRIAPTSLVFGVWDSRGGSAEKRPRIVRSVIRAWDVDPLYAAAQFNSVWKRLDSAQQAELEKEAKAKKVNLSEKGFADAPATFRKVGRSAQKHMPQFRNAAPNPDRRVLGGVVTRGRIERDVTINLVALRRIIGKDDSETRQIRRYVLSLALIAAATDIELFLREGCHLRFADEIDTWHEIPRRGEIKSFQLGSEDALLEYARKAAEPFKEGWLKQLSHKFDLKAAKKLLLSKDENEEGSEEK